MFKKTGDSTQFDLFSNQMDLLSEKSKKVFKDPGAWHNLFREHVLSGIDEELFRPLFTEKMGAPNASIKLLIGMMIIKESLQCSDKQLFEQCSFNLLVRSALGLMNMDEPLPAESTYYLLRNRIYTHQREKGEDLFEKVFQNITSRQVKEFEVSGKVIRMDSKLIGSNIAWYTRYEIIHQTVNRFYQALPPNALNKKMGRKDRTALQELLKEEGSHVVYRSTKAEVKDRMESFGPLIHKLLKANKQNPYHEVLSRIFQEQYKSGDGLIQVRDKEEISSDSVQSPHDTDCGYRNKRGQKVKGYHVNITETCSDDQLNLITDVQVDKANTQETSFVKEAVGSTNSVTEQSVENIHADGAFNNPEVSEFCFHNMIDLVLTGMHGPDGRYDLEPTPEGLQVIDTFTGEIIQAERVLRSKKEKWRIKTKEGYRYFTSKEINTAISRNKLKNRTKEELQRRNNVEATIFQLCYPTRNNKTRYRGLVRNQLWAYCRSMAINLVRIKNYIETVHQRTLNVAYAEVQKAFSTVTSSLIWLLGLEKQHFYIKLLKYHF